MTRRIFLLNIPLALVFLLTASKCKKKDDGDDIVLRDRKEQYIQHEKDSIYQFLRTHTYIIDYEQNVHFTRAGAGQTPLIDMVDSITVPDTSYEGLEYTVYYLNLNPGTGDSVTTCDQVLYAHALWDISGQQHVFMNHQNPSWTSVFSPVVTGIGMLGLPPVIDRFNAGTYHQNNDGTVEFLDFGNTVAFLPSGLAQFGRSVRLSDDNIIPAYTPIIVQLHILHVNTDIDRDHVPNVLEDLNGNGDPTDDNTDKEHEDKYHLPNIPNFRDADDDGDSLPTEDEDTNGNGDPTDDDSDGDGVPNYLDADTH